ncbi:thaumatin-like protein [Phtheirospermum japonicum]|uniref:Thaumatin-like protein n=1 Tax=Phtheirospermum japonicum TaxID=374723 RepID=A0A830BDX6_9LAMI|nr:thaumatin-like protein [Phtheirospermum japonicum]
MIAKSSISFSILILLISTHADAATFTIRNNCPITLWAAAFPGGGRRLDLGETWSVNVPASTSGRIWARTGCSFDGSGRGRCQTGDCNGLLQCQGYGVPPITLAVFALNQVNALDFFDISLVDGFNVPIEFNPENSTTCTRSLGRAFMTDQYCCRNSSAGTCGPTSYSRFFKERCPDAYSYPQDDQTSIFTCPGGASSYSVVWAAAIPGGGRRLDLGQAWAINVPDGTTRGRIWARTGCSFDGSGRGRCQTGDCNGLLQCQGNGVPPNTLAGFALNQFNDLDFYYLSLVDGFNVPIEFNPENSTTCTRAIRCVADINGQCATELRAPGGCNHPCAVYMTDRSCCINSSAGSCGPTSYSRFFKERCPDAYSYVLDDQTSTFTCPGGASSYSVVFCP